MKQQSILLKFKITCTKLAQNSDFICDKKEPIIGVIWILYRITNIIQYGFYPLFQVIKKTHNLLLSQTNPIEFRQFEFHLKTLDMKCLHQKLAQYLHEKEFSNEPG